MNYMQAVRRLQQQPPAPLYLVHGSETFLVRAFVRRLQALAGDAAAFNVQTFDAEDHALATVLEAARQLPMLGSRRVVIVRADAWLAGSRGTLKDDELAALETYARDPTPTTSLAFVAVEVDRRLKAVKLLEQAGEVVRCDPLSESDTVAWVTRRVADRNGRISRRAAHLLVALVGTDLSRLEVEVDKVLAYGAGAPVLDEEHVHAVVSASGTARIFDLLDAVAEGRGSDALRELGRLLAGGEPPLRILAMLSRQMRTLLLVRLLLDRGHGPAEIQRRFGAHPYVVRKSVQQVAGLGARELAAGLLACVEIETDVKTGRRGDEAALELLIARLSSRKLRPAFRPRSD